MYDKIKRSVREAIALLTSRAGILVALAAAGLILGLWLNEAWAWCMFWVCTFSAFDVYIFPTTSQDSAYRIGQFMLWAALSAALYEAGALKALYAGLAFWYFLGCDGLYLWTRHEKIGEFAYWDINIFVAYFKYVKKQNAAPAAWVKASMALGFAAALAILTLT